MSTFELLNKHFVAHKVHDKPKQLGAMSVVRFQHGRGEGHAAEARPLSSSHAIVEIAESTYEQINALEKLRRDEERKLNAAVSQRALLNRELDEAQRALDLLVQSVRSKRVELQRQKDHTALLKQDISCREAKLTQSEAAVKSMESSLKRDVTKYSEASRRVKDADFESFASQFSVMLRSGSNDLLRMIFSEADSERKDSSQPSSPHAQDDDVDHEAASRLLEQELREVQVKTAQARDALAVVKSDLARYGKESEIIEQLRMAMEGARTTNEYLARSVASKLCPGCIQKAYISDDFLDDDSAYSDGGTHHTHTPLSPNSCAVSVHTVIEE